MPFDPAFIAALAAAFLAGLVGGFAGFGGAMIFMPLASAVYEPRAAAAAFLVMSTILMLPMLWFAVRVCRWPTVLPAALAACATVPLGAAVLAVGDPLTLRWGLSALILALLALMASGWRYEREPHLAASLAIGGVSGVLGGVAQVSGPPAIVFWMSGPYEPAVIRANLIAFFSIVSLSSFTAYAWNGFFTAEVVWMIVVFAPAYAFALWLGARIFARAGGGGYRRLAYMIIAAAAITSLPLLDGFLR